jgi:DNA replication protein DnaC
MYATPDNNAFDDACDAQALAPAPSLPPPRAADDPVSAGVALADETGTLHGFLAKWRHEYERDPEGTAEPGFCRHCGKHLSDIDEERVIRVAGMMLPNVCCQPCSDAGKARLAAKAIEDRTLALSGVIPTEFLTWDEKRGNKDALARALGKFSVENRQGLIIHGNSGTCKTRIMWELVKLVATHQSAPSWHVLDAFEASTTGIPKEAYKVAFLFIDDLGNEPKSQKFETALLHLFRRRFDWHAPVTITTQLSGEDFKNQFFKGTAAVAILRRLKERCASIPT